MIDDILFSPVEFILEVPVGITGQHIAGYSLDGANFDFPNTEVTTVFVY